MATSEPDSSSCVLPELPVLPCFDNFPVILGRKFTFSDFSEKTYAEMVNLLPSLIGEANSVVIHLGDGVEPVPFTQLSLNDLESLVTTKLRTESSAIIPEGSLEAFNTLMAEARAGGPSNEQSTQLVYDFVYVSIIEAVAARVIKQFFVITHPFNGNGFTLLGNRGLFTEDKQKRDAAERRMKKKAVQEAKAQAKLEKANSKRSAQEVEEFEHSDVSCHGGKKQPSDDSTYSEDSDSGSDTTVELQPKSPPPTPTHSASAALLGAITGSSGGDNNNLMAQQPIPVGALGNIFPLGAPIGGDVSYSGGKKKKASKSRSKKSKAKKARSAKAAKSAHHKKPKKTVVLKPSKNSSSSSDNSGSSSDDPSPNHQQTDRVQRDLAFQTQAFWLRTVSVKADISDDKYFTLFPIKEEVDKVLAKAHELNMGKEVIEEWRQLSILVNNLIEGLKDKSHTEAIKSLKVALGGARGLNEENSKLARRILRDSQRAQPMVHAYGQQMAAMAPPFLAPQMMTSHPLGFPGPANMGYNGSCFNCGQMGHMARDCSYPHRTSGQGRGARGRRHMTMFPSRGRGGRRGRN